MEMVERKEMTQTCKHSSSLSAVSQEEQHCNLALPTQHKQCLLNEWKNMIIGDKNSHNLCTS